MTDIPDMISRAEAPERVWAWTTGIQPEGQSAGLWRSWDARHASDAAEYTRTDVAERMAQAREAAALRRAHDAIADYPYVGPDETEAQHYDEQIDYAQAIILALVTPDQQTALDSVVREAVLAERERCAKVADEYRDRAEARANVTRGVGKHDATKGHEGQMAAGISIAAAIRASAEGEG